MSEYLSATKFYSACDPKRSRRLELAEKAAAGDVGPAYKQTVTGPSIGRREFTRQDQARLFANLDQDLSVFSFEVARNGERKFLVCSKETFWEFYKNLKVKNYYEVIGENEPCKLYFDLEFLTELNPDKDGHRMTQELIEIVNLRLGLEFNFQNIPEDVLVLESSTRNKFSVHLIFCKTVFSSNQNCGQFVNNCIASLSGSEKAIFSVKDKNGVSGLFIDNAVYTRNRNFRLFLSAKFGKNVSLQTSLFDLHSIAIIETNTDWGKKDIQKRIFFNSLITNVERSSDGQPTCSIITSHTALLTTQTPPKTLSTNCKTDHTGHYSSSSPFIEIDQFVNTLVKPGHVRRWHYTQSSNTIRYDIVGSRWCANVGRHHKSNNVFWVCSLSKGVVVQGCHDYDCRGFRGEEVLLPDTAMPWRLMDEWSDEEVVEDVDMEMLDEDDEILMNASMGY